MIDDRAVKAAHLAALIERLEKLTSPDREVDDLIGAAVFRTEPVGPFSPGSKVDKRLPRYTASLDAVIALVERELPGWAHGYRTSPTRTDAVVTSPYWWTGVGPEVDVMGVGANPAIALCMALLKAKQNV